MKCVRCAGLFVTISITLAVSVNAQGKKGAAPTNPASSSASPSSSPSPSSSGPFEPQMLAYGGLNLIAANIAKNVCKKAKDKSTVVIYDQSAFASIQSYEAFIANIKVLYSSYKILIPPPENPTADEKRYGIGAANTIDPFADATALLSAVAIGSNSETPGSFTIPDSSLAIALTNQLTGADICKSKKLNISYPPIYGGGSATDSSPAQIQSEIDKLDYVRKRAQASIDEQNKAFLEKHTNITAGDSVLISTLTDLNGLFDSFMNSLLQVNANTGTVGSVSVVQGYQLATLLRGPKVTQKDKEGKDQEAYSEGAYILLASIVSAGGTQHTHKNIWTALWTGDKITYSGGLVVNVALWRNNENSPLYASVIRYRSPFANIAAPAVLTNVDSGDNLDK